jgi:hypothetical protein
MKVWEKKNLNLYFVIMEGYLKRVDKRNKGKCTNVFISTLLKGQHVVS